MDAYAETIGYFSTTSAMLGRREPRNRQCNTDDSSSSSNCCAGRRNCRRSSGSSICILLLVALVHLVRGSTDVGSAPIPRRAPPNPTLCDASILPPWRVLPAHEADTLTGGRGLSPLPSNHTSTTAADASTAFALPDDLHKRFPKIPRIGRPAFLVSTRSQPGEGGGGGG